MRFGIIKSAKRILFPIMVTLLLILSTFITILSLPTVSATPITYNRNPNPIYDNYFAGTTWGIDMSMTHTYVNPTNYPIGTYGTTYPINSTQESGIVIAPDATSVWLTTGTTGSLVPQEVCKPYNIKNISHSQSFDNTTSWNDYGNPNPGNNNYNLQVFALGNQYNTYHFYRYWNGTQYNYTPPLNASISYVEAVVRFSVGNGHVNEGYFSVSYNDTVSLTNRGTWIQTSNSYEPHPNTIPNNTTNYWWNSTLVPYRQSQVFVDNGLISYRWDITPFYDWNVSMLQSDDLYVMWTTQQNWSAYPMYIDYIGINYIYNTILYNYTEIIGGTLIPSFSKNFNSILWLLIIFAPALALQFMLPKIGYAFGMFLMLFIFGLTQINFMYVTIIGISALGIMLYKGD